MGTQHLGEFRIYNHRNFRTTVNLFLNSKNICQTLMHKRCIQLGGVSFLPFLSFPIPIIGIIRIYWLIINRRVIKDNRKFSAGIM
ncbi:hypothetical protein I7I50_10306 [Histoplasma capsulatum G186AR]|uniref:Uncharacterized protein n=1 Tax=Ajellomyces capsulatus TaxID=5037 RepID=A0A8H8D7D8_AJECA|nr:hypothetical protein I7I52_01545 [Histoplasma capsulatum]QSS69124.1 hypothetical protein I7I50_10306 [Histoplasma capsulatum G186AR]